MRKKNKLYDIDYPINIYAKGDFLNSITGGNGLSLKNTFSGTNLADMAKGGIGAIGGAVGKLGNSLISGGLESGAGSAITNIGGTIGSTVSQVNPLLGGIISAGSGVLGGITNAVFGSKVNQENVDAVNNAIASTNDSSFSGNADDLMSQYGESSMVGTIKKSDIGKDGLLSNKVGNMTKDLKERAERANNRMYEAFNQAATNAGQNQILNGLYNLGAFGGNLNTLGASFPTGLTIINEGKTHEENPYNGVLMGYDANGTPNLVEEGETIWNDYVFSNRIKLADDIVNKYKLGGDLTYANASKQLSKLYEEMPNDKISKDTFNVMMKDLQESQQKIKAKRDLAKMKRQLNKLSPEEQLSLLQGATQQGLMQQYPQDTMQQIPQEQIPQEQQIPQGFAFGGNLFSEGDTLTKVTPYAAMGNYSIPSGGIHGVPQNNAYKDWSTFGMPYTGEDGSQRFMKFFDTDTQEYDDIYNGDSFKDWLYDLSNADIAKYYNKENMPNYFASNDKLPTRDIIWDKSHDKNYGDLHKGTLAAFIDYLHRDVPGAMTEEEYLASKEPKKTIYQPLDIFGNAKPFSMLSPDGEGYSAQDIVPNSKRIDANGNTVYDLQKYIAKRSAKEEEEDNKSDKYLTWMRYAPIVGSALGAVQALASKPDESSANAILQAGRNAGQFTPVSFNPIGDYMEYKPFDRDYYINKLNAQSGATRRAIVNQGNANRANTVAGLLAADYNAQGKLGDLARQAEEYNLAQRQKVLEFNRGTNQYNSEGLFKADMANQSARTQARGTYLNAVMQAERLRQAARVQRSQAISANLTNLFNNIGNVGRENMNFNILNSSPAFAWAMNTQGVNSYKREDTTSSKPQSKGNKGNKGGR